MADQYLKRVLWQLDEEIDDVDIQAGEDLALANLSLAMSQFIAPSDGVTRGGSLVPLGGMILGLNPLAAILSKQLIIVESQRVVGPFDANADPNGYARLDLVSIGYAEANSDPATGPFINDASGQKYDNNVNRRITANPVVTITKGTAAANPVLPATPAGQIALYQVEVDSGASAIAANKITTITASRVDRIRSIGGVLIASNTTPLPWTSGSLGVAVPDGGAALLIGKVDIQPAPDSAIPGIMLPLSIAGLSIEDAANPNVALETELRGWWGAQPLGGGNIIAPRQTMRITLPLSGMSGAIALKQYRLRLVSGATWNTWAAAYIYSYSLAVVMAA